MNNGPESFGVVPVGKYDLQGKNLLVQLASQEEEEKKEWKTFPSQEVVY